MKKNVKLFLLSFLMLIGQSASGQGSLPKFDISFGIGASAPMGAFAGSDFEGSLVASENFPGFAEGVTKRDNGFANLGFQYHARLGFKLVGIKMFVQAENARHRLKRDEISDFLSARYNTEYEYVQENYKQAAYLLGISKNLSLFGFEADISVMAGTSTLEFPEFTYEEQNSDRYIGRHAARVSGINAFTIGADIRVKYPIENLFSIGLFMSYQSADYDYFYDLKGFPGGSSLLEFDDTVSYRKLDLGIFFAADIF